ncbi:superoxide dismutase, Cu-Zn family [Nannocystis exedens]|uniref:Superoxide dismutase [Cu-Zn] n=1 Tax=Nannocystis exedens TaxID=54 RepID=A0A1I2I6Y9_9BACT|nr:superoxide dismutase family protein [Nannocystis exedens]PCC74918.1 superoxide dismutase [Nannocystis exedens]SFF36636.1 superoxide dismutase, Cu-Zn family [Nannocystis exedens]
MTRFALTLASLPLLLGAPGCTPDEEPSPDATATLTALMNSGVNGTVNFTQLADGRIKVEGDITGLTAGKHGIHVHQWGDCTSPDGESAGGHFNPDMVDHGAPGSSTHHPGDFGNLEAGADGIAKLDLTMDPARFSIAGGEYSVLGRAIIVHEKPDDFGQPTGNAGARLACGVIQSTSGDTTPILNPDAPGA